MTLAAALPTFRAALQALLVPVDVQGSNYPKTIAEFAHNWTEAYADYAMQAVAGGGHPIDAPAYAHKAAFEAELALIPPLSDDTWPFIDAFKAAVLAFWLGMPFDITSVGTNSWDGTFPQGLPAFGYSESGCWDGAFPVSYGATPTAVVTPGTPDVSSLDAAFYAVLSVLSVDAAGKAVDLANALHTATLTVTVTVGGAVYPVS